MKDARSIVRHFRKKDISWALGVSEAVGTVLLLGISVALAGFVALWTSQIEEGEEGIYVDLWASVQGNDLVITHRGGDVLKGTGTFIVIRNEDGTEFLRNSYYTQSATNDESWAPSEVLTIDITGVAAGFDVIITTERPNGGQTVVLKNEMTRTNSAAGLPDLAITMVQFQDTDSAVVTRLNDDGNYFLIIRVDNFGADMTTQYFAPDAGNTVSNLRLFDSTEDLVFSSRAMVHRDVDMAVDLLPADAGFGIMESGDFMTITLRWNKDTSDPRTLGVHTLNVKVVPFYQGEVNYRNNYVERKFRVDKLVRPLPIYGPDPGIYDIYFSNTAPNSGDLVTVTVIIQNSGDQPILAAYGSHLVISTNQPKIRSVLDGGWTSDSFDWVVDYAPYEGQWRSDAEDLAHIGLVDDNDFPTCVKTNIDLLPGAYFFYYFTLEARVDVPGGLQWVYGAIDVIDTMTPLHFEGIRIENGDDTKDNFALASIQVLPRILLVDDDEAATGTANDMTSSVLESLVGSGVTVDRMYTAQNLEDTPTRFRDAPAFDYDQTTVPAPKMKDYDIIIWVTGHVEDPFSDVVEGPLVYGGNIQELMKFLETDRYVLIVGSSPFEGLATRYFTSGEPLVHNGVSDLDEWTAARDFVYKYMGIKKIYVDQDLTSTSPYLLKGLDDTKLTPFTAGEYDLSLMDQAAGNKLMQLYTPRQPVIDAIAGITDPVGVMTVPSEVLTVPPKVNSIRSAEDPDLAHSNAQWRTVVLGWDMNQVKYLNEKINLVASILKWFDWKINVGRDLSITKMELSILTDTGNPIPALRWAKVKIDDTNLPKYLDTILIEATVRNNGPSSESTSAIFYVTGPDGIELPVPTGIPDPRTGAPETTNVPPYNNPTDINGIQADGGEYTIYKLWLAIGVGKYTFRVVADPYHLIQEISEENNDITYSTSTQTSFVTQNNILLVDDDGSHDNFDLADPITSAALTADPTKEIVYAFGEPSEPFNITLTNLGYDHEVHTVKQKYSSVTSSWNFNSGLSLLDLKRYNSVIWVTGDAGNRGLTFMETLTKDDMVELTKYLNGQYPEANFLPTTHHENLMVVGSDWSFELNAFRAEALTSIGITVGDFMDTYLGLDPNFAPTTGLNRQSIYGARSGEYISDIYLGLEYPNTQFDRDFRWRSMQRTTVDPYQDIEVGLYAYDPVAPASNLVAIQFEMAKTTVPYNYFRTISHSWQMWNAKYNTRETALTELVYMSLHWFNTPEDQPELVGRNIKIDFENDNPVLGNSYLVKVEIANIGGAGGGGTVRFSDGSTLIKSENIYLGPNKATTLEAIWTPLYAGLRTFQVYLDYYNDDDEVFETINNVPRLTREVYFFWDDLEGGTGNWDTDSTVVMINGEGRLDYLEEPTTSNIEKDWGDTVGFNKNNNINNPVVAKEYSSSNISYMMHEPSAEIRSPVDVVLVVDTSGSMAGQKIADARTSAKTFVDQMGEYDRVAIYRFSVGGGYEDPWRVLDLTYMTAANKVTTKALIDTFPAVSNTPIWDTIGEAIQYSVSNLQAGRTPAVVALTDGDDWGTEGRDHGSETYAPGSEPSQYYWQATWGRTDLTGMGLKWGDPEKQYRNQDGSGGHDIRRSDVAAAPSWRALQDNTHETRTGLIHAPVYVFSIGLGISPRDTTYVNGDSTPPSQAWSPFTTEYDLWQVAHKSSFNSLGRGKYYYAPTSSELQTIYDDIFKEIQDLAQQATRSDTRAPLETLYFKLDEGSGAFANDASGNGLHGTVAQPLQWTGGLIGGGALDFQTNNMITVPDSPLLNTLDIYKRSFSFWIDADVVTTRQVIYRQGSSADGGFVIYIENYRIYAGFWADDISTTHVSLPFRDTLNWHHVVFTFDSTVGAQVLFVDNIPSVSGGMLGYVTSDAGDVIIGRSGISTVYHSGTSASNNNLDAALDDFRIYNVALEPGDIKELYEQGLIDKNGLRAEYYSFTGGTPSYSTLLAIQFENNVDYNWAGGNIILTNNDRVVIRWTGYIVAQFTESYTFYVNADDGVRLFVNDIRIINSWSDGASERTSSTIMLTAGNRYSIVLEYYEQTGNARSTLSWASASQVKQVVPSSQLFLSKYSTSGGGGGEGGGGGSEVIDPKNPWTDGSSINDDKWLLTKPIDLRNVDESMLSFYQKYNLKVGSNGGVIQIGTADNDLLPDGGYHYRYIQPDQPYTGNTLTSQWSSNVDDYGTPMRWAWNGKSGGGTLGWDYITVNLDNFVGHYVKVKFLYIANYGGTGYGWMIDDVKVTVSSRVHSAVKNDTLDNWNIKVTDDKNLLPTQAWFCGDDAHYGGDFKNGIDNSLYTRPIDLTNARTAILSADLKFNIQEAAGRPPDGFRVEVSTDNGIRWIPLSLGVRTSWGVSGSQADITDGLLDGKSFTGLPAGNGWVRIETLARVIVNLDGFIGNTVILRFRVVTNIDNVHYENGLAMRGLYLDNVIIYGESLEGSRSVADPLMEEYLQRVWENDVPAKQGTSSEAKVSSIAAPEPTAPARSNDREPSRYSLFTPLRAVLLLAIFSVIAIGAAAYIYIKRK